MFKPNPRDSIPLGTGFGRYLIERKISVWTAPVAHTDNSCDQLLMRTETSTMKPPEPSRTGRASAVREVGALSDLDKISVRIADVAARLAVLGDRLRDELRSSTFP